jgi:hypothetical protein
VKRNDHNTIYFRALLAHPAEPRGDGNGDADVVMTIYFDPDLLRAVRLKAASLDASISNIANEAVRRSLSKDAADLEALEKRRREP